MLTSHKPDCVCTVTLPGNMTEKFLNASQTKFPLGVCNAASGAASKLALYFSGPSTRRVIDEEFDFINPSKFT